MYFPKPSLERKEGKVHKVCWIHWTDFLIFKYLFNLREPVFRWTKAEIIVTSPMNLLIMGASESFFFLSKVTQYQYVSFIITSTQMNKECKYYQAIATLEKRRWRIRSSGSSSIISKNTLMGLGPPWTIWDLSQFKKKKGGRSSGCYELQQFFLMYPKLTEETFKCQYVLEGVCQECMTN